MLRSRRRFLALRQHLEQSSVPRRFAIHHPVRSVFTASSTSTDTAHDNTNYHRQRRQAFSTASLVGSKFSAAPFVGSCHSFPTTPALRHSRFAHSAPSTSSYRDNTNTTGNIFVSRHNNSLNLTAASILDYCQHHGISKNAKTNSSHVILRECPFCTKPTNDKLSNLYKLHIKIGDGAYFCHRCGNGGSWYDFKATLGGYAPAGASGHAHTTAAAVEAPSHSSSSSSFTNNSKNNSSSDTLPAPPARLSGYYNSRLLDAQHASNDVLQYLTDVRGLSRSTLRHYGVGRATYNFPATDGYEPAECVTFPWIEKVVDGGDDDKKQLEFVTRRIKVRALQEKGWQRLDPPGGGWGLFGLHTVPDDATTIILTEGEYDAMAVYQETGLPAVSLPNGCRSLPLQVLPLLEKFEKIVLWMDQDGPGQEGAEKFAKKLGMERCHIVQTPLGMKDANEVLLKNMEHKEKMLEEKDEDGDKDKENVEELPLVNMRDLLNNAKVLGHDRILTFEDLRADVLQEFLEPEKFMGTPVTSLPGFTKLIKGHRKGELTVLTGPTGSGKTTFLGQVSIDMAEQGQNVLWGSFEIKNTRLMQKLLTQFSKGGLPEYTAANAKEAFLALADRFQNLPLYFMSFHGGSDVDEVLDAMEYAVYVNDVQHIILDNMQFMITRNVQGGSSFDKFDTQDVAIEKFRKFATEHNIHITLVVHPRKEDETAKLSISSFYGSAKATQEADTVLILQAEGRRKYIEVKKNRFDGTLGTSPLYFNPKTGRYVETETGGVENNMNSGSGGGGYNNNNGSSPGPDVAFPGRQQQQATSAPRQFHTKTDAQAYTANAEPLTFQAPRRKQSQEVQEYDEDELENFWNECLAPPTDSKPEPSSS